MDRSMPDWITEVLIDLSMFSGKNGLIELSHDLQWVCMKHTGNSRDTVPYRYIIDASFNEETGLD